jgi:hypothetical protein
MLHLTRPLLAALSCLLLPAPLASAPPDSFEFREVARVPLAAVERVTCGDADHDGFPELYAVSPPPLSSAYAVEFYPDMRYETTAVGLDSAWCWFVSDLDRDGNAEVLLSSRQSPEPCFSLLEGADSLSLPSRRIWQRPGTLVMHAVPPADLDADSRQELILGNSWPSDIYVYECDGDDSLAFRGTMPDTLRPDSYVGFGVCRDLDRDGRPELATAPRGEPPSLVFFEAAAAGVDSYRVSRVLPLPLTGYADIGAVEGAADMDGDGRTEAIVMAGDQFDGLVAVYESPADDSFELVWHALDPDGNRGFAYVSVGDVDGDSVPEFSACDGDKLWVFRCAGDDSFEVLWQLAADCHRAGLYDLDRDGRAEVIVCVPGYNTVIYKFVAIGVEEPRPPFANRQPPSATVCRGILNLQSTIEDRQSKMLLVDVSGRKVMQLRPGPNDVRRLPPGLYFLRMANSEGRMANTKVLIVE